MNKNNINTESVADIKRGIKMASVEIDKIDEQIRDGLAFIKRLRAAKRDKKSERRYLKSQIKTAVKIEICDQALQELDKSAPRKRISVR